MLYGVPHHPPQQRMASLVSDGGMVSENDPGIVFPVPRSIGGHFSFYIEGGQSFRTNTCSNRQPAVFCLAVNDRVKIKGLGRPEMSLSHRAAPSSCASSGKSRALYLRFLVHSLGSEFLPRSSTNQMTSPCCVVKSRALRMGNFYSRMHCFLGTDIKLPQAGWLRTTEMYSLIVLEAGNLKSRGVRGLCYLWKLEKSPPLYFWWPQYSLSRPCNPSSVLEAFSFLSVFSSLLLGFRAFWVAQQ